MRRRLRRIANKIPNGLLNTIIAVLFILVLFTIFDVETLKKIEIWDISSVANTIDGVVPSILAIFEKTAVKIAIYVLFGIACLLRIIKFAMKPKAIVLSHSSFSNAQSTYDESVVSGYSVKHEEINLVNQIADGKLVEAVRKQDSIVQRVKKNCDEFTELFYYGIAHIPLICRVGFQVGNEGKVRLLHKYRNEQTEFKEISSDRDNYSVELKKTNVVVRNSVSKEMLVVVETTFPVTEEDLKVFYDNDIGFELHFELEHSSMYGFDSIVSYDVMTRLRSSIMNTIRDAVKKNAIQKIHLVLATSSDFAFFLAQDFSRYHDPEVIAYQYDRNSSKKYPWGISNISSPENAVKYQSE